MRGIILFTIICLLISITVSAQERFIFEDSIAMTVSASTVHELHQKLTQEINSDKQKLRVFYTWIAHNINYDVNEIRRPSSDISKQMPGIVLKRKMAVCHGYSVLFKSLCDLSDIKCFLVSGYFKQNNNFVSQGHTWNVVLIDDQWLPVDVTWGAGGVDAGNKYIKEFDDSYFLAEPVTFLESHYAMDPAFQLVGYPVNLSDYKKNNWSYNDGNTRNLYHYNDTILNWIKLDTIQQRLQAAIRMIRLNPNELMAKKEYNFALTDQASFELNKGNTILNELYPNESTEKNAKSKPIKLSSEEIFNQLNTALKHINKADEIFTSIKPLTTTERNNIQMAKKVIQQNIRFIESKKAN